MRKEAVLVTGANGEIGHGLIERIAAEGDERIVALDLQALDIELASRCHEAVEGSILDAELLDRLVSRYEFRTVYHLAALLSTRATGTWLCRVRIRRSPQLIRCRRPPTARP